jgi:hypothetical protein
MSEMSESAVRELRNRVFDHVISDMAWSAVRNAWLSPGGTRFLLEHDFPLATPHSQEYCAEHQS